MNKCENCGARLVKSCIECNCFYSDIEQKTCEFCEGGLILVCRNCKSVISAEELEDLPIFEGVDKWRI